MNLLKIFTRKITDRKSGLLHEYTITEELVPAIPTPPPPPAKLPEVWEIRWKRYENSFMPSMVEEVDVFYSTEEAEAFGKALHEAYKLTKHPRLRDTIQVKRIK